MSVNLVQLKEGMSNERASDGEWVSNVENQYKILKSALNVNDDYTFNINPLQSLFEQLDTLIKKFQQFIVNNFLQPLIDSIEDFGNLLESICKHLSDAQNNSIKKINNLIYDIGSYTANNFKDIDFFVKLSKNDETTSAEFKTKVPDNITAIGDEIAVYIKTINLTDIIKTVKALSVLKIDIPSFHLENKVEVDVLSVLNT